MYAEEKINYDALKQIFGIAEERSKILQLLRSAILDEDIDKIIHYSRKICGLDNESY